MHFGDSVAESGGEDEIPVLRVLKGDESMEGEFPQGQEKVGGPSEGTDSVYHGGCYGLDGTR